MNNYKMYLYQNHYKRAIAEYRSSFWIIKYSNKYVLWVVGGFWERPAKNAKYPIGHFIVFKKELLKNKINL